MADRYARQISLAEIGARGQDQLAKAAVTIVGCGGLGAIAAAYLAGAGIGRIRLIDGDGVDVSNLHRQVFYASDSDEPKAEALANHLRRLNPEIEIEAEVGYLTKSKASDWLDDMDMVLECTDQAETKHLVSDYCALRRIPLVYGAVHRFQGYLALFANQSPDDCHLRDLFPQADERLPTCAEVGVFNTAAGLIGMLQANEALKWLLQLDDNLNNRLLTYDCMSYQQQIIRLRKNYLEDPEETWQKNNYGEVSSPVPEISWAALSNWEMDTYRLFSLLPEVQESKLVGGAIRFSAGQLGGGGRMVFYCKYGRQSLAVAKQLRAKGLEAYSVAGGREALTDER